MVDDQKTEAFREKGIDSAGDANLAEGFRDFNEGLVSGVWQATDFSLKILAWIKKYPITI